ncbi:MAG: FAD-dependent oxidoreductase, partial [Rhodoferax sp.]|nr:FAD-dependent oxidoreductase [Rhodoferax sp.]
MLEPDILVIGGGPAGVAAATDLAEMGFTVLLAEQRDGLGGAIHRPFVGEGQSPLAVLGRHRRNWQRLQQKVVQAGSRITTQFETVFLGVDGDARFLLDDRRAGRVISLQPQAVVLALGAVERVLPRPGWELPGVSTAGGMQVQLKETGEAPKGPILVAGTGPLSLALAAQLTAAGNPPVEVLERGQPFRAALAHVGAAIDGLRSWANMAEGLGYGARLLRAGVPYRTGCTVTAIEPVAEGLRVTSQHDNGAINHHHVRHLALHDGLTCNNTGLPTQSIAGVFVVRAGDCREVLGAEGAVSDGRRAAQLVAKQLGRPSREAAFDLQLSAARRTQNAIWRLFEAPALSPTPDTVICRCEGLRRADFDGLKGVQSAREIRLVGRFGMGACQGRFCARAVKDIAAEVAVNFEPGDLGGTTLRWPLRPVSVA